MDRLEHKLVVAINSFMLQRLIALGVAHHETFPLNYSALCDVEVASSSN